MPITSKHRPDSLRLPWWVVLATITLMLGACGGGGDDDSGDNGMNPPPNDDAALTVPLEEGNVWTYREISNTVAARGVAAPETSTVFVAAAGTQALSDGTYHCLISDDDGERDPSYACDLDLAVYVRQEDDLFYYVPEGLLGLSDGDDAASIWFHETARASLPWAYADFTAQEGTERILLDDSTTISLNGGTADLSILVRSQELGAEAVDVPAGRFVSRRTRTILTTLVSSDEGNFTNRITQNFWFVDDIGLARVDYRGEEIEGSVFISTEDVTTRLVEWDFEDTSGR